MEFARRGPATAAVDEGVLEEGRRFLDSPPQPHGDSMHVIRDALLAQLQKDRLRQEMIVAELARIERTMDLRSGAASHHGASSSSAGPERANPAVHAQLVAHGRATVGPEHHVGVDENRDLKKEDAAQGAVRIKYEKPDMEDDLVREWSKPSGKPAGQEENACSKTASSNNDKAACQGNAATDVSKQESAEAVPPKKTPPSVKWSCGICQVEATSEGNLMQHFAGQKHRANIIALKAKAKAEKSRKAKQYAGKPGPTWVCKFCPANCTGKSTLENHLNGKKHHAKIQALLEECKSMARDHALREAGSNLNMVTQDEGKPDLVLIFCGTCQVKCVSPLVKESHVRGKKHQMNVQALQIEAKRLGIMPPKIVKKQQAPKEWDCTICQAKCNSESQFHQKKEDLQREGGNAYSMGLEAGKKFPTDGSDGNGASLEREIQKALFLQAL